MGYTLTHDHLGQNYYANTMSGGPAGFCIHHAAGTQLNVKSTFLANSTSANYSIKDTDIVCYVEDANGTWHCGDNWGNRNLISIECVNSGGSAAGWPVSETTVDTLVEFLADKCVEHGISSLTVGGNLYKHSDFYATYCPGVLADRMEEIASRVNDRLETEMASVEEIADAVWRYTLPCDDGSNDDCGNFMREIRTNSRQLTRTDDPSGRGVEMVTHDHIKWIAKAISDLSDKVDALAAKIG